MSKEELITMAKNYYPKLWDKNRIYQLYVVGKIIEKDYVDIVGEQLYQK